MNDKFQLHTTAMESLAMCGIRFEKSAILGERRPPSARMLIGAAVDRSVRANLESKMQSGSLLALEQAEETARDTLISEWANGVRLNEEDGEDGIQGRDKALDMSVGLSGLHHSELAPRLNPTHVARRWALDISGLSVQLVGEIDIQEADAIRDTKTSGKSPVRTMADDSLQLSVYALADRQLSAASGGPETLPKKVVLDYLIQTPKRGDQKLVQLESVRTLDSLQPVLARVEQMDRIIQSGMFTPAPVGSWYCSAKWCAWHDTCKYAARPVSVAVAA
jgi:hypothetical protein